MSVSGWPAPPIAKLLTLEDAHDLLVFELMLVLIADEHWNALRAALSQCLLSQGICNGLFELGVELRFRKRH